MQLPSVKMSASWFFAINVFDLAYGIQVDSVKLPIELDSVGSGHVSRRRTPALNNHLDHSFISRHLARQRG